MTTIPHADSIRFHSDFTEALGATPEGDQLYVLTCGFSGLQARVQTTKLPSGRTMIVELQLTPTPEKGNRLWETARQDALDVLAYLD